MPATAVSANVNTTDIFVSNSTHFAFGVDGSGNANSHIVFNGTNLVIDSDSDAGSGGAIILDSGGNGVGIDTSSPEAPLHVENGASGYSWTPNARTVALLESSNAVGTALSIISPTTGQSSLYLGDTDTENRGQVRYQHDTDTLVLYAGEDRLSLKATTEGVFNEGGFDYDFRVESNNNTHILFVDAGLDRLGVNTSTPAGKVEILDASNQGLVLRSSQSASANTQSRLYGGAYSGSFSAIAFMNASVSNNALSIGGGTAAAEPATQIDFYTGAVGSLGTGTLAMQIDSSGNVGIGTSAPDSSLHVFQGSAGTVASPTGGGVTVESSGTAQIAFLSPNTESAVISFGDPDDNDIGRISYSHSLDAMLFYTSGAVQMVLDSSGNVGIGTSTPARPLHVDDVMRLEPRATAPSSPSAGDIFFNSSTNKLQCYDGSVWQDCF